ncbi:MAG: helix-turn-helix transcriptional regulator [Alphaproteobacteria bacterium]|nr:helix-turn-helix transcriptional regulator [Alphaproteobacteria bacterium]
MKTDKEEPKWLNNLRALLVHRKINPRALSLKAGLNATAVRDMLEGRARFPRYDTVESLAKALEVTPAQLMGGTPESVVKGSIYTTDRDPLAAEDLNLLTEIIARLQEVVEEQKQQLKPHDFAAMVTTIYRQVHSGLIQKVTKDGLEPQISHLITYETLRKRVNGK